MSMCHECRLKSGYRIKDKGSHTVRLFKCDECKQDKAILPDRHWVKVTPSK